MREGGPINVKPFEATVELIEQPAGPPASVEAEALGRLSQAIQAGRPWAEALLEAMSMWTLPEERVNGRLYRYVIQGEAFDCLLLAERMCTLLRDSPQIPEIEDLIFAGRFPSYINEESLKNLLGYNKYRGFLNFWYGVVVEEALHVAVEEEVRKDMRAGGRVDVEDMSNAVFRRIYDDEQASLIVKFREKMGYPNQNGFSLTQSKEFTYWLFKHRLYYWDPARVASDTRKGLNWLERVRGSSSPI